MSFCDTVVKHELDQNLKKIQIIIKWSMVRGFFEIMHLGELPVQSTIRNAF